MKKRLLFVSVVVLVLCRPDPARATLAQETSGVFLESLEDDNIWLPLGNIPNEGQRGNTYSINVSWDGPFGTSKYKMTVTLSNVSSWRGIAGNFGSNTNPDLRIEDSQNPEWDVAPGGQSATTKEQIARQTKVKIVISSFDFAASGRVTGSSELYYIPDSDPMDIPKDDDHEGLPNVYEKMFLITLNPSSVDTNGNGVEDDDEDNDDLPVVQSGLPEPTTPAGARTTQGIYGDGLTNWEEYRGFVVQRAHVRTNWKSKDLFIATGLQDLSYFALVKQRHPATVRIVQFDEMDGQRLINANNLTRAGTTAQRALFVQFARGPRGVYGQTFSDVPASNQALGVITVGPNGICDTQSRGDDSQLIPFGGAAAPNTVCIDTGPNGFSDTTAEGDDVQLFGPLFVSLTPNETQRCDIYYNQIELVANGRDGFLEGANLTIAHECGHGTDMEHYDFTHHPPVPGHKKPSIMAADPATVHPLPDDYDAVDYAQMRLHRKHP